VTFTVSLCHGLCNGYFHRIDNGGLQDVGARRHGLLLAYRIGCELGRYVRHLARLKPYAAFKKQRLDGADADLLVHDSYHAATRISVG
jgi:hypothetical protein